VPSAALLDLADARFVQLTTYRRSGVGVPTPVWIARDGDALLVTTPAGSGKVKRLRNDPRVTLRPCSRMGKVADDAPIAEGRAEVIDDDAAREHLTGIFRAKYGLEYGLVLGVERRVTRDDAPRIVLRITAP
jgi:uncharacterized protein